jgi:enoyl-CoA hydratase/carnithine racemase
MMLTAGSETMATDTDKVLKVLHDGPVTTLLIDRPERRHALNAQVVRAITDALDAAEADPGCRVLVLGSTGDGVFCAGADLERGPGAAFAIDAADPRNFIGALLARLAATRLPLIARVQGPAFAGALGLIAAADLVVAADSARFALPEVKVGTFPLMITPLLLRVLPARVFMRLCLTGEPIGAAEALRVDFVNEVVPAAELDRTVAALAASIAANSPTAIRLGKQALGKLRDLDLGAALAHAEIMSVVLSRTEDGAEGPRAFLDKRPPQWTGR